MALIQPITITFTSSSTTIGQSTSIPSVGHLRIQIIPSNDGKNINSIKICYFDQNSLPQRFNEEIVDTNIFESISHSIIQNNNGSTLVDKISSYMRTLPNDDISIIMKEYSKYIEDGILLDGFIAGIASYFAFFLLNENSVFMNQMLFQITMPYLLSNCNILTKNMFRYVSLPLLALSKISHGVLLQLIIFIQSFINIWEPAFIQGCDIDIINETKICMEIISGLVNDATIKLSSIQSQQDFLMKSVNNIESRLRETIDDSVFKMKREINNLIVETRQSVKELSDHVVNQSHIIDSKIKEATSTIDHTLQYKIGSLLESELDDQIKDKIVSGLEETQERVEELVKHYTMNEGKKIITDAVNEKESEMQGTLIGLEHRIEILYNKLSNDSGENTVHDFSTRNNLGSDTSSQFHKSNVYTEQIEFQSLPDNHRSDIPAERIEFHPSSLNIRTDPQLQTNIYKFSSSDTIPSQSYQNLQFEIVEEKSINVNEEDVTPISDDRTIPIFKGLSRNSPERLIKREINNINGGRRVPFIHRSTDSNPTPLSEFNDQPKFPTLHQRHRIR